ncbi:hypothetical protein TSUD_53380 [Trifolium subterraneum]|uniref:Pollen allergen Ole e 1 family n=1 Tax=Trifolium subterraneum TaxID=3900 RepID=A0A2Z6N7A3_TRISU|nr:hypothetical protein TSUD_53380 [Trifolium subterraneum]
MARSFVVVALIVSAFYFSCVLAARKAPSVDEFSIVGKIYCDPCHFQFESRLSKPIEGVKVTLVCKKEDTNNVTLVKEGTTDANGVYRINCGGDHEEEVCEVNADSNHSGQCPLVMINKSDRIVLTNNMGFSSSVRLVNPLGFMTEAIDDQCGKVISELGLDKLDD